MNPEPVATFRRARRTTLGVSEIVARKRHCPQSWPWPRRSPRCRLSRSVAAKESVNSGYELSPGSLEFERRNVFMLSARQIRKKHGGRFIEKRPPTWKGR